MEWIILALNRFLMTLKFRINIGIGTPQRLTDLLNDGMSCAKLPIYWVAN